VNVVRSTLRFTALRGFLRAVAAWIDRQPWLRSEPVRPTSAGLHSGLVSRGTRPDL
jgi:hypothetical protein